MGTIDRRPLDSTLPLLPGERLEQATFHERYEQTPPDTMSELIGGVVYLPAPEGLDHGDVHFRAAGWLGLYMAATPGVRGTIHSTTILDVLSEVQPDASLRILPEYGGQTRTQGRYLAGAPELVVEISRSSRDIDLGAKREDYERAGVLEYVVVALDPDEVFWFVRRDNRFAPCHLAPKAGTAPRSSRASGSTPTPCSTTTSVA